MRLLEKKFILIIVVGGIFISLIVFIGIYFLGKKIKMFFSLASIRNGHMEVTYRDLHNATNGFSSSNLVGAGSFGSVFKGSLHKFEGPIVVKVLKLETHGALKSFMAECKVLEKMKHKNLLKLLTFCSSVDYNGEVFKAIVFEFMPMGNLDNLLHNNEHLESRNLNINLRQRLSIALDVAQALDYLHHNSHQVVVHCDIKPSNVLLDDDIVAYLGDFGLARFLHGATGSSSKDQVSSSAIQGTIGYVPPGKKPYNS
jgi:serine/threonine protein kinase